MSLALLVVGALLAGALLGYLYGWHRGFDEGLASTKWLEAVLRRYHETRGPE